MMIWFVLILVVAYIIYKKQKSSNNNPKFKNKSNINQENTYLEQLFKQYVNKINLKYEHPVFSHDNIRLKCIYAGIRNPFKQKLIILSRYLLIIPGGILGAYFGDILAGHLKISVDLKVLFISIIGGAVLGYFFPVIRLDSMIETTRAEIKKAFPDFLDIMLVCVGAGMTAEQAYIKVYEDLNKFSKVMAYEVEILSSELTYFLEPKIAYDNFYHRTQNDYIRAYVTIVLQSIQYGTPLSTGLKSLSEEVREKELGDIEKKAASLPSKLTVPMMIFTLPVLFVVIGFPAAMQVMDAF